MTPRPTAPEPTPQPAPQPTGEPARDPALGPATGGATDLAGRLHRLRDAAALLARHGVVLPDGVDVPALVDRAERRLRHGTDHTVVALVGSTGSGKSSLLNAVAGEEVARAGVTRPTTAIAQALTIGPTADGLLDDLGITRRHHLAAADGVSLSGLVLLDLPDVDSVATAHRREVDRLVPLVDLLVFVTDPQKYADQVLHTGYLQPLATHADVIEVVLNKADLLDAPSLARCLADLRRLLGEDGLGQVTPIAVSATAPTGVDPLVGVLAAEVAARQAATDRLHADVDAAVDALLPLVGAGRTDLSDVVGRSAAELVDGLAAAAGVPQVTALLARQHRRDAALATGWPPARWLRRIRRAPLAELPVAARSQVARAEVSRALRATGSAVADRVGPRWADPVAATAREAVDPTTAALDRGISREVQQLRQPPRWWRAAGALQGLLLAVALVGGLWLVGVLVAGSLLLVDADALTPRVGQVPLPTLLLLGGAAAGVLLAVLAGVLARVGARRRSRAAREQLRARVAAVAEEEVVDPLRLVLADAAAAGELLAEVDRGRRT